MAKKATSVYLTVSDKGTHKTAFFRMFFKMGDLNEYVKQEDFVEKYPQDKFYFTKEIY